MRPVVGALIVSIGGHHVTFKSYHLCAPLSTRQLCNFSSLDKVPLSTRQLCNFSSLDKVSGLQVERRLEHYASCRFLGSLGLGLPTHYACRPIWPSRRNGEEAGPFRDLLPLDTEIDFTNNKKQNNKVSALYGFKHTMIYKYGRNCLTTI